MITLLLLLWSAVFRGKIRSLCDTSVDQSLKCSFCNNYCNFLCKGFSFVEKFENKFLSVRTGVKNCELVDSIG